AVNVKAKERLTHQQGKAEPTNQKQGPPGQQGSRAFEQLTGIADALHIAVYVVTNFVQQQGPRLLTMVRMVEIVRNLFQYGGTKQDIVPPPGTSCPGLMGPAADKQTDWPSKPGLCCQSVNSLLDFLVQSLRLKRFGSCFIL